ncbi:CoA transferase [Polaromonas sp. C04]|uniref:CaiB/BaiF CoA transferase family protein n=1 Tax=Polaromonas sp. C04 TaxID=1945857 RepID=UPI000985252F|nr:CoA transferase [Polaromonas sp. C04]OOG51220.1 formyl-CoA transferase [Polaromonas sp. C04]
MNKRPLEGLKVLDLTRFLAGPYCTMLLGDHGAEVLKVEPPDQGDPTRVQGPPFADGEGLTFLATNRNKHSVVLDLKKEDDLRLLRRLAATADVLVENFRPGVLKRFDLDYAALRSANPKLIYASISGFGSDGPMAEQGAFDLTIQALGGYMSITGEPGGRPVKLGTSAIDMLAGMNLYSAILVALLERGRTGLGQWVETSLLESQVAFLSNAAFEYLLGFGTPGKMGSEHPQLVPYKAFETSDGWIVIGAGVQNLFEKLVCALGREELIQDPSFSTLPARLQHRQLVNGTIEALTRAHPTDWLVQVLSAAGVPSAPVATIDQVFQNPQVMHRQMKVEFEGADTGRNVSLGSAVKYSGFKITEGWSPAPRLNEGGQDLIHSWLNGAS